MESKIESKRTSFSRISNFSKRHPSNRKNTVVEALEGEFFNDDSFR